MASTLIKMDKKEIAKLLLGERLELPLRDEYCRPVYLELEETKQLAGGKR